MESDFDEGNKSNRGSNIFLFCAVFTVVILSSLMQTYIKGISIQSAL